MRVIELLAEFLAIPRERADAVSCRRATANLPPNTGRGWPWKDLLDKGAVGRVPVTYGQWQKVVIDADMPVRWKRLELACVTVLETANCGDRKRIGKRLRAQIGDALECGMEMTTVGSEVSLFTVIDPGFTTPLDVESLVRNAILFLEGVLNAVAFIGNRQRSVSELTLNVEVCESRVDRLQQEAAFDEPDSSGALMQLFRPGEDLAVSDDPSTWMNGASRVSAAWSGREDELVSRVVGAFLHVVTTPIDYFPDPSQLPIALLASDRPIFAQRALRQTLDFGRASWETHREGLVGAIVATVGLEQESWHTHLEIGDCQRRLSRTSDMELRARDILNLYRIVSEGWLKYIGRAILSTAGVSAGENSTLTDLLNSLNGVDEQWALTTLIRSLLRPDWRNASAHLDIKWDELRNCAITSSGEVDLDRVLAVSEQACSVKIGFETGIALLRAENADFREEIDRRLSALPARPVSARLIALEWLARQGLRVKRLSFKREFGFVVSLEGSEDNPGMLAAAVFVAATKNPIRARWNITVLPGAPELSISPEAIDIATAEVPVGFEMTIHPLRLIPLFVDGYRSLEWEAEEIGCAAVVLALRGLRAEVSATRAGGLEISDVILFALSALKGSERLAPNSSRWIARGARCLEEVLDNNLLTGKRDRLVAWIDSCLASFSNGRKRSLMPWFDRTSSDSDRSLADVAIESSWKQPMRSIDVLLPRVPEETLRSLIRGKPGMFHGYGEGSALR